MPGRLAALLAALLSTGAAAAGPQSSEEDVKAAFLLNFARFVEWPPAAFPQPDSPFVISVLGKGGLGEPLDRALKGKTHNGRAFLVRRSENPAELLGSHLVFVADSEKERWAEHLASFKGRPTLLVGDSSGFAASGGAVNFTLEDRKVRIEINPAAAARSDLKISSKLLTVARVVKDRSP
jgi:hypothetical protein